jgi:hypothetical protein
MGSTIWETAYRKNPALTGQVLIEETPRLDRMPNGAFATCRDGRTVSVHGSMADAGLSPLEFGFLPETDIKIKTKVKWKCGVLHLSHCSSALIGA